LVATLRSLPSALRLYTRGAITDVETMIGDIERSMARRTLRRSVIGSYFRRYVVEYLENNHPVIFELDESGQPVALFAVGGHAVDEEATACLACNVFRRCPTGYDLEQLWPPGFIASITLDGGAERSFELRRKGLLFLCETCEQPIIDPKFGHPIEEDTLFSEPPYLSHALHFHNPSCATLDGGVADKWREVRRWRDRPNDRYDADDLRRPAGATRALVQTKVEEVTTTFAARIRHALLHALLDTAPSLAGMYQWQRERRKELLPLVARMRLDLRTRPFLTKESVARWLAELIETGLLRSTDGFIPELAKHLGFYELPMGQTWRHYLRGWTEEPLPRWFGGDAN
jgi:hypothetical protein